MPTQVSEIMREDLSLLKQSTPDLGNKLRGDILISGATGMLLSYLPRLILHHDSVISSVRVILLVQNGARARSAFSCLMDTGRLQLIEWKANWQESLRSPVSWIVHGAGRGSPADSLAPRNDILDPNVIMTRQLLDLSRVHPVENFLFISSGIVYGAARAFRTEDDSEDLSPQVIDGASWYQKAKLEGERMGFSDHSTFGIPFKAVRPAHCFGPTMRLKNDSRLVATAVESALTDGVITIRGNRDSRRSFVYLTDAISGIIRILSEGEPGRAYNLASSENYVSIQSFCAELQSLIPDLAVIFQDSGEPANGVFLKPSLLSELGWRARISLHDGLRRTLEHFSSLDRPVGNR